MGIAGTDEKAGQGRLDTFAITRVIAGSLLLPRKTVPSPTGPRDSSGFSVRRDLSPVTKSSSIDWTATTSPAVLVTTASKHGRGVFSGLNW